MTNLSHCIDVTRFQTVLDHLKNDNQITGFINVEDQDLATVGAYCVDGDIENFSALIKEGKISKRPVPANNAVDVLYLPPFYVFKDRKTVYQ